MFEPTVTPRDQEICAALAPLLREDGLYFVGLDVIGNYLTEVNVTSPTGIQEINSLNGVRLESQVMDFIENQAAKIAQNVAVNLDSLYLLSNISTLWPGSSVGRAED